LVPDKKLAFQEIYRVLKPGGRISLSDMVATRGGRKDFKPEEWASCIAGAVTMEEYRSLLVGAGFVDIEGTDEAHPINQEMSSKAIPVKSVTWKASKPS
jgi:SAM-dependent methyltransferase